MSDTARTDGAYCADQALDDLLAATRHRLTSIVNDRVSAQGGSPELRDADLALSRTLARVHRGLGAAVEERLANPAAPDGDAPAGTQHAAVPLDYPLADRLAPVRMKYRSRALQTAQSYSPRDLLSTLAGARRITENVISHLESDSAQGAGVQASVHHLETLLEKAGHLTESSPPAATPASDYLRAVRESLEIHAAPLLRAVHNALQLLKEELEPLLADPSGAMDSEMVTRDLADDLDQAWVKAQDLSRAVSVVQAVSNDFTGDDLRQARLEGALLAGVRWNASTTWPEEWEPRIRRASTPTDEEPGVLIITAEPSNMAVTAEV